MESINCSEKTYIKRRPPIPKITIPQNTAYITNTSLPYVITQPGEYIFEKNLFYNPPDNNPAGNYAIDIRSSNVAINFNGYELEYSKSNELRAHGIHLASGYNNIFITGGCEQIGTIKDFNGSAIRFNENGNDTIVIEKLHIEGSRSNAIDLDTFPVPSDPAVIIGKIVISVLPLRADEPTPVVNPTKNVLLRDLTFNNNLNIALAPTVFDNLIIENVCINKTHANVSTFMTAGMLISAQNYADPLPRIMNVYINNVYIDDTRSSLLNPIITIPAFGVFNAVVAGVTGLTVINSSFTRVYAASLGGGAIFSFNYLQGGIIDSVHENNIYEDAFGDATIGNVQNFHTSYSTKPIFGNGIQETRDHIFRNNTARKARGSNFVTNILFGAVDCLLVENVEASDSRFTSPGPISTSQAFFSVMGAFNIFITGSTGFSGPIKENPAISTQNNLRGTSSNVLVKNVCAHDAVAYIGGQAANIIYSGGTYDSAGTDRVVIHDITFNNVNTKNAKSYGDLSIAESTLTIPGFAAGIMVDRGVTQAGSSPIPIDFYNTITGGGIPDTRFFIPKPVDELTGVTIINSKSKNVRATSVEGKKLSGHFVYFGVNGGCINGSYGKNSNVTGYYLGAGENRLFFPYIANPSTSAIPNILIPTTINTTVQCSISELNDIGFNDDDKTNSNSFIDNKSINDKIPYVFASGTVCPQNEEYV